MPAIPPRSGRLGVGRRLSPSTFVVAALMTLLLTPNAQAAMSRVSIDAPRVGAVLSGETVVFASTTRRATKVVFYVDGAERHTERNRPNTYLLDSSRLANGRHTLKVRATFPGGSTAEAWKGVTVKNAGRALTPIPALVVPRTLAPIGALALGSPGGDLARPTVRLRAPADGASVAATISGTACEAVAADNVGIARVEFAVDGKALNVERNTPYNCTFDTTTVANGSHTLRATAYDAAGNASAPASLTMKVANSALRSAPTPAPTPTPTPTPAPAPAPTSAQSAAEFVGDFETGSLSQWTVIQRASPDRIRAVAQTDSGAAPRQGRYMGRFEVRDECTNVGDGTCTERSELLWGSDSQARFESGSEDYIGFSSRWEGNFVCPPSGLHSLFLQPKAGSGSPAFSMENRDCQIRLRDSGDITIAPLERSVWHDFVLQVKWSASASVGHLTIYHKRADQTGYTKVVDRATDTLTGSSAHLKLGYYRNPGVAGASVIYHDGVRAGKSFGAVAP